MAERAIVPGAVQQGPSPGKDHQAKGPDISHGHDSGCYTDSLDQPTPDVGQMSKEETERGDRDGAELCVSGRGKEREDQVEPAVSSGQDVACKQPTEEEENSRSFPAIGPRILDHEDAACDPNPGKATATQDDELEGQAGLTKPQQESQPPLSCSGTSLAVPDSDMAGIEPDLTRLKSPLIALQSLLHSVEKTFWQARNDLLHAAADVNPTALHEMLLDARLEISKATENLLMATATADLSNYPANQTNQNPAESDTNLPASSSSHQSIQVKGEVSLEDPVQGQQCSTNVRQRVETSDELQEEPPTLNEGPSDSLTATEGQLEDGKREDLPSGSQEKEQEPEDLMWVGATPNKSTEDSVSNDLPCDNLLKTNVEEEEGAATATFSSLGKRDSSKKTDEKWIQVKGSQEEDQKKREAALNSQSENQVENPHLEQPQQKVPKEHGVASTTQVKSGHLEEPKEKETQGKKAEKKEKLEDGVTSHTKVKSGCAEGSVKTEVLPNKPVNEGHQDNTHVKMGQSEEPKTGMLSIITAKEDPPTRNSLEKRVQSESPKNSVKNDPPKDQDKTRVSSNTQVKRAQSEEPAKNIVLSPNNPVKEDSADYKDNTGVPSTCSNLEKVQQPEKPKKPAKKDLPEDKDKTGVSSNTHVKAGQSEPKSKFLFKNPAKEDSPDNKDKTGVPSTCRETEKLKSPVKEEPPKNKYKAGVSSNTQVKMGQTEEPAKKGIMSTNFHPVKDNGKDKTSVPSNSQEERSRAEYPLKKGTLSKKSVKDDKAVDLGQNDHCSLSREQLVQNEIIVEEEDEITTLKKVLSDFILPEEQEDATAEKGTPIKAAEEDEVRGSQPVCSNSKKLETVVVNKRDEIEEENTSTSGKQGLIVQIRGDTSCHGAQEMPTSTEIPKKASLKTWMNRKLSFLIAVIVGLYSFLTSWSRKEQPPDTNSYSKTDTTGIPLEHDVQVHVYHMQSQDQDTPQDTPQDQDTPPDTADHGDDQADDHNTPDWLVQEDVDDDDLYGPTVNPATTDSTTVTAEPCTEGPEGGELAVDVGLGGHTLLPTDQLSATASGHCSQHLHRTPTQVVQDVLPATCALESDIQHYRETERGISVTVLDIGGQVLGQTRIFAPTTVQEHLLEHVAALAFAACPMHGFTIRWPGGRTVPLGTLLDPHTAQNIILQMHHADEGDGTWQWRIVEILVGGRSAYTVEVNIHQQVSDGISTVWQSHSEQDWDTSEPGSRGDEEKKVKDEDGKGSGYLCTICMDIEEDSVVETSCKHCFHKKCLQTWLQCQNTCPMCRKENPQNGSQEDADRSRGK